MPVKPFPYLIDRLVPENAITSLTADSGAGKSLVALYMAKAIAEGTPLFGEFKTKKTKILIIDQEMDEDLLIGRFKAVSDTPIDNIDIMYEQFWSIDEPAEFNWLIDQIRTKQYGLVIFDTLTMIHSAEENSSMDMKKINQLMLQIIAETKSTIMYLHHHRKLMKGEKNGMASSRGSTEIIAKVASHLQIESKKIIEESDDEPPTQTMILQVKISQEKERRPEGITKIGVDFIYRDKKTTYEYKGVINEDKAVIDQAKEMIIGIFEADNSMRTKDAIQSKLEYLKFRIGDNNLGIALKSLESDHIIQHLTKKEMIERNMLNSDEKKSLSPRAFFYNLKEI